MKISSKLAITNPILSVITVVKNDEFRFSKTVKSLKSLYGDARFEHVVIDGKSIDRTVAQIKKIELNTNVRVSSNMDNGIYDAMNQGIKLSLGEYLLFLNCGDELLATNSQIEQWLIKASQLFKPDIICFPSMMQHSSFEAMLIPRNLPLHKMPTSHQAMIFSKEFACATLYDDRYKIAGDFNLYLSASRKKIIIFPGNEPLTRIELEGYASQNPLPSYIEYLIICSNHYKNGKKLRVLALLLFKAAPVVILKKFLPKSFIGLIRRFKWSK